MKCAVEGCDRSGRLVRGWCNAHYKRWARFGNPTGGGTPRRHAHRECSVDSCSREHYGKGYCTLHYRRYERTGDPLTVLPTGRKPGFGKPKSPCSMGGCEKPAETHIHGLCGMHKRREERKGTAQWEPPTWEERFWAFVDRRAPGECWPWTGAALSNGYGQFYNLKAHRVAYELLVGPIPDGLTLDHTCHTYDLTCPAGIRCAHRRCVNPAHLEPVTMAENIRRGWERAHRASRFAPLPVPDEAVGA